MARRAERTAIGFAVVLTLVLNAAVVSARTGGDRTERVESGSAVSASVGSEALTDGAPPTAPGVPGTPGSVTLPGQWTRATTTTAPRPSAPTTSTTRPSKTTSTTAPASVAGIDGPGLHVVAPDGTGLLRLTGENGGMFTWSPDGTRLAQSTGRGDLVIVLADGSGRSTLPTAYGAGAPVWSPDGRLIAFNGPTQGAYVARTDGSEPARLIDPAGYLLSWTPQNQLVVLTQAVVGGFSSVVLYDLTGGRRLLATDAGSSVPAIASPDGRLIAYMTNRVMVAAVDGSGSRPLTAPCCAADVFPWPQRWSPDSRQLALVHYGDLWVARSEGAGERLVADKASSPAWSPDGRLLAIIDARTQRADGLIHTKLAVLPAGGGERRTVYDPGQVLAVHGPQWSPNGRQIAVIVTQHSLLPPPR